MNKLMVIVGVVALFITMEVSLGAEMGEECSEDGDCPDGDNIVCKIYHMCENGTCACKRGYELVDSTCKAIKRGGEACTAATDVCEPGNDDVTCQGDTPTCSCAAEKTWVGGMCVTTADYIALDAACTTDDAAKCYGHVGAAGEGIYVCDTDDTNQCKCAENYMVDSDHPGICIKKKYDTDCDVGPQGSEHQECMTGLECRALTDGAQTKCICPAQAQGAEEMQWNPESHTCVAHNAHVGVAKGEACTVADGYECAAMLYCKSCPDETELKCRDVKTGGGGGSGETGGAAHLAAGVATIILSAVAMFL